ncbi:MAG: PstS family phosphate ABC transporter substrate-binding protein [Snowella sp.]|nr:PstS family phosphate ABC transporter substrate-binding protein [Snowella sp.]
MEASAKQVAIGLGALLVIVVGGVAITSLLAGSKKQPPSPIQIDGSSTVFPITDAIAKEYNQTNNDDIQVKVGISGTTGGFKKFCEGETDINNASRPITPEEMEICNKAGVRFSELPIAFDALTVVVNPQNTWAKDITLEELKKMWEPSAQGKITNWKQIRASYPDKPLRLFGAGKDSGTYDYFNEVVIGDKDSRTDYVASEDDNAIVQGVSQDPNALGYFGLSYYEEKQNQLKALGVDSGKGAILPSRETVEKAKYQPLSRPLFIYVNQQAAQDKPEVLAFVRFYLENAQRLVTSVGDIPLPNEAYHLNQIHFDTGKVGTVFEGKPQPDLTISELLRKRKAF